MSESDRGRIFDTLSPPPGGLTRLRARIRADRRHRLRNRSLALSAATTVALVLPALLLAPGGNALESLPGLASDPLAIRMGLVDPPAEVVSIRPDLRGQYAVRQVPTSDERVVFYMIGSLGASESRDIGLEPAPDPS